MKNTARQHVSGKSRRECVCGGADNAARVHWANSVRLLRAPECSRAEAVRLPRSEGRPPAGCVWVDRSGRLDSTC